LLGSEVLGLQVVRICGSMQAVLSEVPDAGLGMSVLEDGSALDIILVVSLV
jgi:hypothetical protein